MDDGPAADAFRPIGDYGAIGDLRSMALVSSEGSLDWWCPGRFDAPSVFAAILDRRRGGHFRISPRGRYAARNAYVPDTNVLTTTFRASHAEVRLVDFAPLPAHTGVETPALVRRVECLRGDADLDVEFAPRFDYGRVSPRYTPLEDGGHLATGNGELLHLEGPRLDARPTHLGGTFHLDRGESLDFVLRYRGWLSPRYRPPEIPSAEALQARTVRYWLDWSDRTRASGRYAPAIKRSALVLKLLTYEPSGAVVAAGTTSLPEEIRGVRNWDYRYTWVRDAAFSVRALYEVGHESEARRFVKWLVRVAGDNPAALRIMYGVRGERHLTERTLDHLSGYRNTRPVRVGNAASEQRQLDVYGELLDVVHRVREWGFDVESPRWQFFRALADWVCEHWREPDSGIWEVRSEPKHFVLSKAMAWCALDRASEAVRDFGLDGDADRWDREAAAIVQLVDEHGYDEDMGAFRQAFHESALDASNLLMPLIGFVDAKDPRMMATVDRTLETLTVDGLVYRYLDAEDGLPGHEATFTYCTFWLIEVLAMQGRLPEAREIFDRVLQRATHLGLYAEELDPSSGEHLGNYPQAFPHIGLILAALRLDAAERGEDVSAPALAPPPRA